MIMGSQRRGRDASGEGGSALIIVLMMIAMLGVLTLTLATLSVNNLVGARRAAQAGVALNAADAGLAQAVAHVRENGVTALCVSPGCVSYPWGSSAVGSSTVPTPVPVPGTGGASFAVSIKTLAAYPANNPGLYQIQASGLTGSQALRYVTQDITVAPQKFPLGIFGKYIDGGGSVAVHKQSMFTTGCVYKRSHITFVGPDLLNNLPAASVHSSQIITEDNGSGVNCSTTKNKDIHDAGNFCNPTFPYDQDKLGGPLAGTPCLGAGGAYPQTSLIADDADLFAKYNLTSPPLTAAQLEQLKMVAKSQGNYWTSASGWTSPIASQKDVVMYFDLLTSHGEVNLNNVTGFSRAPGLLSTDAACVSGRSLVIIVNGGSVGMNSNQNLAASVFVLGESPYGSVNKINGGAEFIGTLYANMINLKGGADLYMDDCFKSKLSPALFDVQTRNYREEDRGLPTPTPTVP